MTIEYRLETPDDYRKTENMIREAFWNVYCPGCFEHFMLHQIQQSSAFIESLDFVAVKDGRIIGNVISVQSYIEGDDGQKHTVLSLGPIGVLPAFQRTGVGRRLIELMRQQAARMGYKAILLCGDPAYYSKNGFEPAEKYSIRTKDNKFAAALQILWLRNPNDKELAGRYFENEIYEFDSQEASLFDRQFPTKEKISGTPTQKRFDEVVAMQKDYF